MVQEVDLNSRDALSNASVDSSGLRPCGLCRRLGVLQESHLLPAWCYRRIIEDCGDAQHVQVTKNSAVLSNDQVQQFLLCRDCEERFAKIEDKVERLTRRRSGKQIIFHRLTCVGGPSGKLYELDAETAGILSYFAVSVIWRAHAMGRGCELGPYEVKFRRYLLGEDCFPDGAVLGVMVLEPTDLEVDPKGWLSHPASARVDGFRLHGFIVCGLVFRLFVGRGIPVELKIGCLAKTTGPRYIHVRPWHECRDVWGAMDLLRYTTPRGKLARRPTAS